MIDVLTQALLTPGEGSPFRIGVVQSTGPTVVRLGDDASGDVTSPPILGSYSPAAADVVLCAMIPGGGIAVLGSVGSGGGGSVPAGSLFNFGGSAAPTGYLLCYGQSVATVTYPALFTAIGYTFGGAGANFTIPDLRGRIMRGKDNMGGSDAGRIDTANTVGATDGLQYNLIPSNATQVAAGGDYWAAASGYYDTLDPGMILNVIIKT